MSKLTRSRMRVAGLLIAAAIPAVSHAQIFNGVDSNTGIVNIGASTPNSNTARSSMVSALGSSILNLNTFELLGLGETVTLGGGVTASYSNQVGFGGIQTNSFNGEVGFNTTAGGTNFLGISSGFNSQGTGTGTLTLTFSSAINFFGGYVTGRQTSCGSITATWGANSFLLPNSGDASCGSNSGVQWFGFVSNTAVNTVTFTDVALGDFRDVAGIDDIIYGTTTTTVPEPSTYVLLGAGLAVLGVVSRRKNRAA